MSKVLICGDIHWSQYSSIVRKRNTFYSQRLENLLWSVNWVEKTAAEQNVDKIIYLGDFMDRATLNAEELTAFRDIVWAEGIEHIFLTGNHETSSHTLEYSSIHFIESLGSNFRVINEPTYDCGFGYRFFYLPYIFESDRKPLGEYIRGLINTEPYTFETQEVKTTYIFSHNDIKGVQYGCVESKEGFEVEDIAKSCSLYINGHIHNGDWVKQNKILNLGNLTGQNFNEDGFKYHHRIMILDTLNQSTQFIENPYAFNFLKTEINSQKDLDDLQLLPHSVLSVRCAEKLVPIAREFFNSSTLVEEYRIISIAEEVAVEDSNVELNSIDHLQQFQTYILEQLGSTETVVKELTEVLK